MILDVRRVAQSQSYEDFQLTSASCLYVSLLIFQLHLKSFLMPSYDNRVLGKYLSMHTGTDVDGDGSRPGNSEVLVPPSGHDHRNVETQHK